MKNCETYQNWLLEEELTTAQKTELDAHLATCAECRKVQQVYQMMMSEMTTPKQDTHPEDEVLVRYVMFLDAPDEPDHEGRYFTPEELRGLKQHFADCPVCAQKVQEMQTKFLEMAEFVEASPLPDTPIVAPQMQTEAVSQRTEPSSKPGFIEYLMSAFSFKNLLIPATGLAVVALLFMVNPFRSSNPYEQLTDLGTPQISYLTRSNGTQLQKGIQLFNNGEFVASARALETILNEENGDVEEILFARYVAGVSYLFAAKNNNDKQLIDKANAHLTTVYQNSANLRIKENAGWYLAKAALLKNQPQQAAQYLREVVQLKGMRADDAKTLLDLLEKDLTKSE
jgi:hypothetical protein